MEPGAASVTKGISSMFGPRLLVAFAAVPTALLASYPMTPATAAGPVTCAGQVATVVVTAHSPHVVYGTGHHDVIAIHDSGHVVRARAGSDLVCGSAGQDVVYGGAGADHLYGNHGADHMYGGHGDDTIRGRDGDDHLYGGPGADHMYGGPGDDYLRGGAGVDYCYGGTGHDLMHTDAYDHTGHHHDAMHH